MIRVESMPLRFFSLRRNVTVILAFVWFFGLLFGIILSCAAGDYIVSLMRLAVHCHVSIVGLAVITVFPLFLSAFVAYVSVLLLIFPVCFFEAFIQGFLLLPVYVAFGDAGWLVHLFCVFSDTCMTILLLWFWVRCFTGNNVSLKHDFIICFIAALMICFFDYFLVSPYLMMLMSF